jgi:hypothetical protein
VVYRHILNLLCEFFGDRAEMVLAAGLAAIATAVLLLLSTSWRRGVAEAQACGGWRAVVMGLAHGLITLLVGATLVAGLGGALLVQSGLFSEHHGQVTERNAYTIRSLWGPAHEQRELAVGHYLTEEQTVLVFPDGREIVEEVGQAENLPTGEQAPTRIKRKVRKQIPQNSIVRGRVTIDVQARYVRLGSAYYTGYEDTWTFDYTVRNRSDKTTEAEFSFPLPSEQSDYRDFKIQVDGDDWRQRLVVRGGAQTWKMTMAPNQEVHVVIAYSSTGTEHVRYAMARMAHRDDYRVTLRLFPDLNSGQRQIVWQDLRPLVGGMKPSNREVLLGWAPQNDGDPIVLEWALSSSLVASDMGVVLPKMTQPGWYVARLLHEAPLGLMLLAAGLVVTWLLLGRETHLFSLGVLVVAYYLFYTLIAYLSDHLTSFTACFVLSALATLLPAALYLWLGWGRTFAAHQSLALVTAFTVYYPLAIVLDDYTGLMVQILYWGLAVYAAMLAVVLLWRRRSAAA